jgi:acyl-CoA synthetase (AMP-forming)/AMP-acid ligase II
VYNDHERYETNYFKPFPGYYFSGDGARRDKDGYIWITGRVDDVINVSGHRYRTLSHCRSFLCSPFFSVTTLRCIVTLPSGIFSCERVGHRVGLTQLLRTCSCFYHRIGTAEVESALVAHPQCAEAAVVGYEHPIKGQGIYAYVTLMEHIEPTEDIRRELIQTVRGIIGAFAAPDVIHWVSRNQKDVLLLVCLQRRCARQYAVSAHRRLAACLRRMCAAVVQVHGA